MVLAPALLLLVLAIVVAGRIALAHQAVDLASGQAAREASLARNPGQGAAAGRSRVRASLAAAGTPCSSTTVDVRAAALGNPPGQPGSVTVTVRCPVALSDVALPGTPGTVTVTATAEAPIDQWVSR